MAKAPIKAFKQTVEYYFTANQADPLKSDFVAKEVLYFSNKIPIDEFKEYLETNFDEFCINGWQNLLIFPSVDMSYNYANTNDNPDTQGNIRGFSRYLLPDKWITTFDAKMPIIVENSSYIGTSIVKAKNIGGRLSVGTKGAVETPLIVGIDDYDIGINYNRDYINIKFIKDNGEDIFNNLFTIRIDPITSEDLEACIMEHYQSFLLLGITSLILNEDRSNLDMSCIQSLLSYQSNQIMALESIGAKI